MKAIRQLIFLYLVLWVIEGALRRWVLPGLATPLLIVRDPVVLAIYYFAFRRGLFPFNGFVIASFLICYLACTLALIVGHGNFFVAAFGTRVFLLHLPLLFVVPRVMDFEDVVVIGRWCLVLVVPMTVLMVIQHNSGENAWVNRGVGGEGSAAFTGAMDKIRPPGTWSFISGPSLFYPLATAFWFALYLARRAPLWLLLPAGVCILVACPISISRGLVLGVALVAVAGLIGLLRQNALSPHRILTAAAGLLVVVLAAGRIPQFQEASEVFMARWESAAKTEGGDTALADRVFTSYTAPFELVAEAPLFGHGIGIGTNAGAKLATGSRDFLHGEGEWFRILNELGPILGLGMIALRGTLTIYLFIQAWNAWRTNDPTPSFFFAACAMSVLGGQWGQATTQGGMTIGAALLLASAGGCRSAQPEAEPLPLSGPQAQGI
ncbi:MAG: hypothetical protein ACFB21_06405 [Opitutales bacterium]